MRQPFLIWWLRRSQGCIITWMQQKGMVHGARSSWLVTKRWVCQEQHGFTRSPLPEIISRALTCSTDSVCCLLTVCVAY